MKNNNTTATDKQLSIINYQLSIASTRAALRGDFPALAEVWADAFGNFGGEIEKFLVLHFKAGSSYVLETASDGIIGAAHLVYGGGIRLAGGGVIACPYLYALAIKSDFRGRGYGSELLKFVNHEARALGFRGTALCPEREPLFAYYKREGYGTELKRDKQWTLLSVRDYEAWYDVVDTLPVMLCTFEV
ncbi:MAG: GNAT family N-acetyltransferase [Oscillospiraceae bacterium]|jgi:GNAT superfamily N-acetyltransferase|nr:GNAT family N-acetyltransferase [Oscillospiraceae bacterium]